MSFYQAISSSTVIGIYTGAVGLLFINSISDYIGRFFVMWIKLNEATGIRLLSAETPHRPYIEFYSKVQCYV